MTTRHKKKSVLCGWLCASLLAPIAYAQTPTESSDEEIYELSPFVVDISENVGYLATSTLAGTRIKTSLSDVGSAISVLTPEVFEDTGATDAESILPYSLNVEVAGTQGNFADTSFAGSNRVDSNSLTRSSQSATRVRGLSSALLSRGLFETDIPFDSYNTTAVTVNRGPNSLLFGATTPGGVVDQSLKQAEFGRDFGSIQLRIGERDSLRMSFDYNTDLIENRLAFRVNLLDDKFNYQQKPTYKHDKRVYAAINAVVYEGSKSGILGRTSIRANVEYGDIDSNPPKIIPPGDALTDWFQAPDRSLQEYTGTVFPDWVDNYIPKQTIDNSDGSYNESNLPFSANQPFFINMAMYYAQPDMQTPSMGIEGYEYVAGMPARTLWRGVRGLQGVDTFGTTPFYNGQPTQYTPGFTVPVIMDRNIFDNQNMAITGNLGYRNYDFDTHNIALEQELFDGKGGIEISYDSQSYDNDWFDPFTGGSYDGNAFRGYDVRIDLMENMTNGQPNPNVGRAYMVDINTPFINNHVDRETTRATAFYNLDFTQKEGWTHWLGRHVFTGFYSHSTVDRENRDSRNKWIDIEGSPWSIEQVVNNRINEGRRNLPMVVYLTDSLLGSDIQDVSDIHIDNYMSIRVPQPGDRAVNWFHPFFQTPANTTGPSAPLYEEEFEVYRTLIGGNALRQITEGKAFSWQSFLFDGNIVGLVGWRKDRFKTIENISLANFVNEYSDANSDGLLDSGEFDERRIRIADEDNPDHADQVSSVSNPTMTWSVVAHLPEQWVKLPFGANLSFHYNESETFVPTRTRRDFNGNVLDPETGETKEYGFTVQLFEKQLSIRVNWFELTQNNATASGSPGSVGPIADYMAKWKSAELDGIPFEEALMEGFTERPVLTPDITSYEEMYAALINLMPQRQQEMYNLRFSDAGLPVLYDPNPGEVTLTNAVAKGFEIDVVGNITDNWRVMVNYGQQETTPNNSAPIASEYVWEVWENMQRTGLGKINRVPGLNEINRIENVWINNINTLVKLQAKDGTAMLEQRKHRVNLLSTYRFGDDSFVRGLTVGGAIRWQSSVATGYESYAVDGVVTPIIDHPYMGPEELNGDVWVSYEKKLEVFGRPIDWKIQLNVRNAIGSDDYIPVVTNPNGEVAVVRNPPTQEWFLTNTFNF